MLLFPLAVLTVVLRALFGSILGISIATLFCTAGLVVFGGVPTDLAITVVALGMNAMLLSLLFLGSVASGAQS
ncbi:hypothetical protein [Roseicyclus persicicus]|uniref:hypothetical protein n=1 Tax=Roseicyclus persicicus TaxID=2650661 RepID=UPI001445F595|nr:hypothetical protein [Roseibacterium persicicum]